MSKLLVVDFDFFFPVKPFGEEWYLYDWSHAESKLYMEILWPHRAAAFVRAGLELPGLSGEQVGFWDRMEFTEDAYLYFGESNVWAADPLVRGHCGESYEEVWLFDQHHDCGYNQTYAEFLKTERMTCEDWMYSYRFDGSELHVRYPRWINEVTAQSHRELTGTPNIPSVDDQVDDGGCYGPFDCVYVCRSGAWVPPWCDDDFLKFVEEAPLDIEALHEDMVPMEPRHFDMDEVHRDVQRMEVLMNASADVSGLADS